MLLIVHAYSEVSFVSPSILYIIDDVYNDSKALIPGNLL